MLERGTTIEAKAGDAGDREFHRQHVASLAGRVVTGCTMDSTHRTAGKGLGVKTGSSLGVLVVPQANRVLGHACPFASFRIIRGVEIAGLTVQHRLRCAVPSEHEELRILRMRLDDRELV